MALTDDIAKRVAALRAKFAAIATEQLFAAQVDIDRQIAALRAAAGEMSEEIGIRERIAAAEATAGVARPAARSVAPAGVASQFRHGN